MSETNAQIQITSFADLEQHQGAILDAINKVGHGAELLIADPFRFLAEIGFVVSSEAQSDLLSRAPSLSKAPKQLYDKIKTGNAVLAGDHVLHINVRIGSLAVQEKRP